MDNRCDNLKYNAYREIVDSIDVARSIIYNMKLAYGESAIVPFWYPAKSDPSVTSRDVYTLMGTGSMNGSVLFTSNLLTSDTILDQATIKDFEFNGETYGEISLKDAIKIVDEAIEDISGGKTLVSVLESLVNEVSELKETLASDSSIYEGINQSLSDMKDAAVADSSTLSEIKEILAADSSVLSELKDAAVADSSTLSEIKETLATDSSTLAEMKDVAIADSSTLAELKETLVADSSTFNGICQILDDRLPVAEIEEEPSE